MTRLSSLGLLVTVAGTARAQGVPSYGPPPFAFQLVAPGVYATIEPRALALSPFVHGNSMFVIGDSAVVAFDANRTPSAAAATLALLRQVTPLPVTTLVISHFHGDHVLGAQAFVAAFPGLDIIATDSTRDDIVRSLVTTFAHRTAADYATINARYDSLYDAGVNLAGRPLTPLRRAQWDTTRRVFRNYYSPEAVTIRVVTPGITFERRMTLWSGQREIQLLSFGRGDTRSDAVMWLPRERVVATGDLLVDPAPYSGGAYPSEWLHALREVRALNPLVIVPGHGEVQHDTKYLDLVITATDATIRAVRRAFAAHLSEEATTKRVTMEQFREAFSHGDALTEDRWEDFRDTLVAGAYAEAKAARSSPTAAPTTP